MWHCASVLPLSSAWRCVVCAITEMPRGSAQLPQRPNDVFELLARAIQQKHAGFTQRGATHCFAISVVALRAVRQRLHLARAAIRALFGLSGQTFEAMTATCKHRQYCLCFGCVWNPPRFLSYDQSNVFAFGFISRVSSALLWFIQVSY